MSEIYEQLEEINQLVKEIQEIIGKVISNSDLCSSKDSTSIKEFEG